MLYCHETFGSGSLKRPVSSCLAKKLQNPLQCVQIIPNQPLHKGTNGNTHAAISREPALFSALAEFASLKVRPGALCT